LSRSCEKTAGERARAVPPETYAALALVTILKFAPVAERMVAVMLYMDGLTPLIRTG
jgi:hypothetical protein